MGFAEVFGRGRFSGLKEIILPPRPFLTHDLGHKTATEVFPIGKKTFSLEPVAGITAPSLTANFSAGVQAPSEETRPSLHVEQFDIRDDETKIRGGS